jgi:hypothetical protein
MHCGVACTVQRRIEALFQAKRYEIWASTGPLVASAEFRQRILSFIIPVCPPARNKSTPSGQIFMKCYKEYISKSEICRRIFMKFYTVKYVENLRSVHGFS